MKYMLIDGNSILNRAFYGVRLLTNHDGLFTNAIYGFLATYFKLETEEKPDRVIVCFDVKGKTFRHKEFEDYKGTRKGMPDELAVQLPVMKEVLDAMGVNRCELEGYEADDLLGTLSRQISEEGNQCVVVTGDKDSLQLIGNGTIVKLVVTRMGQTTTTNYDTEVFREKYGFDPIRIIDLKGLMGDSSDNIPGVPGIGEKTATTLIQSFGSIDGVYENIEDPIIKKGARTKLIEGRDMAELSRRLATIDRFSPVDIKDIPDAFMDEEDLYNLFTRLEFKNFITRLKLSGTTEQQAEKNIVTIDTMQKVDALFDRIAGKQAVCIQMAKDLSKICLIDEKDAYVFLQEDFGTHTWREVLESVFSGNIDLIIHDAKDYIVNLMEEGFQPKGIYFDTAIAGYLLDPTESGYALDKMALGYLNTEIIADDYNNDTAGTLLGERDNTALIKHADIVQSLYKIIKPKLDSEGMTDLLLNIEIPLMYVLADMQVTGFQIDTVQLKEFGKTLNVRVGEITSEIYTLAGGEFNINSPKQLGEVLFEKLSLPSIKKTKTGYSTNIEVLEQLKGYNPIIELIIEYRQLTKLISTYVDGLLKVVSPEDGRIHSHFQQTVTATGRLSSTEPNLQNIPVRQELGSELRRMFVADEGKVLIDADYSQIELRVLAHIADDHTMIDAFKTNKDIHTITASQAFKVPMEEVTPLMRSNAKAVNFGIVYGISDFSLAGDIGVTKKEAGEYINAYLETYNGVRQYMDNIKESAKEKGYVESMFGRRRYLPELKSKNFNIRSFGERVALNTPIQATAADIIKIAMVNVYNRLKAEKKKSRLILQVHDELIIEATLDEKDDVVKLLQEEMENAASLHVPLTADAACGDNWYTAKKG